MNPLAPPAGGAFFMRGLLCATGAASARWVVGCSSKAVHGVKWSREK